MRKIIYNFLGALKGHFQSQISSVGEQKLFYHHLYYNNYDLVSNFFDPRAEKVKKMRNLRKETLFCRTNVVNIASFPVMTPS